MPYIPMIDPETGEIDQIRVAERIKLRAASEYGSSDFPPSYLRNAMQWCADRALAERTCWRRDHGLPDDRPVIMMDVAQWGASGDSFGAR